MNGIINNSSQSDQEVLIIQAEQAMADSNWHDACRFWADLRALAPDEPKGYARAALALRKLGDFDASDQMLMELGKRFGVTSRQLITLGDTAMDRKDWSGAVKRWAALRNSFPETSQGYYRAAQALRTLGEIAEANRILEERLSRLGDNKPCLIHYAENAMKCGDWREADKRWKRLRETFPDEPLGYARGATALEKIGNRERADEIIGEGMDRGPNEAVCASFLRLARVLDQSLDMQIDRAKKVYATGIPCKEFSGSLSLIEKAQTDPMLSAIIEGKTIKSRKRKTGSKLRVVFYFPAITQTDHLMPIYEKMFTDPRFEPIIFCSRNRNKSIGDSFNYHRKKFPAEDGHVVVDGGPHVEQNSSIYELDADLVFFHTPYSHKGNHPFYLRAEFISRHTHMAHINYGYFLLSLKGTSQHIYNNVHTRSCDLVFCESPVSMNEFGATIPQDRLFMTGYPKFDTSRQHITSSALLKATHEKEVLDIIWTPHWRIGNNIEDDTRTSNFLNYKEILLRIAQRSDVQLHVRPHPLLRTPRGTIGLMSHEEYDAILAEFTRVGAQIYPANDGAPYLPSLMSADVLISDFSSLLTEYCITRRPIVFCRTHEVWTNGRWIGPFGKSLIETCCYIVDCETELEETINNLCHNRDHTLAGEMDAFIRRHDLFPEGSAVERICDTIEKQLAHS